MKFRKGMAICIEPMVNMKSAQIRMAEDGWTALAVDGLPSAHFEHDVVIALDGSPEVLSSFEEIEKVLNNKSQ